MKNIIAVLITLTLLPFAANAHETETKEEHAKHDAKHADGHDHTHADHTGGGVQQAKHKTVDGFHALHALARNRDARGK